jgi:hypothetical protein
MTLSECRKQAWAGSEAIIHKASFTERRLFYLIRHNNRHYEGAPVLCPKQSPYCSGDCFVGKYTLLATLAPHASAGVTNHKGLQ